MIDFTSVNSIYKSMIVSIAIQGLKKLDESDFTPQEMENIIKEVFKD